MSREPYRLNLDYPTIDFLVFGTKQNYKQLDTLTSEVYKHGRSP
jgi:hypothetical protein